MGTKAERSDLSYHCCGSTKLSRDRAISFSCNLLVYIHVGTLQPQTNLICGTPRHACVRILRCKRIRSNFARLKRPKIQSGEFPIRPSTNNNCTQNGQCGVAIISKAFGNTVWKTLLYSPNTSLRRIRDYSSLGPGHVGLWGNTNKWPTWWIMWYST